MGLRTRKILKCLVPVQNKDTRWKRKRCSNTASWYTFRWYNTFAPSTRNTQVHKPNIGRGALPKWGARFVWSAVYSSWTLQIFKSRQTIRCFVSTLCSTRAFRFRIFLLISRYARKFPIKRPSSCMRCKSLAVEATRSMRQASTITRSV